MYIVYEAFDDNTATIIDLETYGTKFMTEQELINFGNKHSVLGLSVSGHRVNYITAYNCLSFATEEEADDYIRENGLSYKNKRYAMNLFLVLEKNNHKRHVDYYIYTRAGDEVTYVMDKGYTHYIQAAKTFDKKTAGERAASMTQNSRTGKYWTVQRVVVN